VRATRPDTAQPVRTAERYGFVWVCLGEPERDIVDIPETAEADRLIVAAGAFRVGVSALRAVENFLDLGHLAFVHDGCLGAEPHTEVTPYEVTVTDADEVLATGCRVYQPLSSPTAKGGMMVDYIYRVLRPCIVCLYKTNPLYPDRDDSVFLLVQPVDEETCVAYPLLCYVKEGLTSAGLRAFMQMIFCQDKPILENQVPKRLPLDPRAETPIRADASSIVYRRWLRDHGVTYGAIPAPA